MGAKVENPYSINGSDQINIGNQIFGNSGKIAIGNKYQPNYGSVAIFNYPPGELPTEVLEVDGNIMATQEFVLNDQITAIVVNSNCAKQGQMFYSNDSLYGCTSTGWKKLNN